MKLILQQLLFLDERSGKFSTSKFMTLVCFYFIMFLTARSLYLDRELKNTSLIQETFLITSTLYFGRRFSFKTKNLDIGANKDDNDSKIN